jgi:hypothetical protein
VYRRLPELKRRLKELEDKVAELENRRGGSDGQDE